MQYIAYIRVSTKKQGVSGLGLESQREIITREFGSIEAEYVDIVSGKNNSRKGLMDAIAHCRRTGATLVVAKIDRLARRLSFACELLESGIQIKVAGMPSMTTFVFHILCAVAEEESRLCSERTKAALAAAKARGTKLGGVRLVNGQPATRGQRHAQRDDKLVIQCQQLLEAGQTYAQVAEQINAQGHRTPKGGLFSKSQVHRLVNH